MKRVSITLYGKSYEFATDGSEELINYVNRRIKDLQLNYKNLYEEIPFDELLVLMLCDLLEQEYNLKKNIESTLFRLKEKLKNVLQ
ncbi:MULTISPECIES: cell division protein ZapA [Fervidobacterium]|uniref:Cell division protein ZapA n=1 Tax=Fervidobacterium nodosum (strain ATCC 35602 / DSM 5306 / Rt17-B1) TaxID=381764 RepID=A7HM75_FERNB|nr:MULTISPECIES: cell division protein ZapA [Fervidobacterium]ABS61008.1 hypothetical protein Fnod_1161 [Fervidobacterium nodosum Rt17-B1]KAF2962334.1 cell division protein ZapA [Fervidobacterium sp. 2310opik-2]PHJ12954.1 cell division protein ZapA [Fervidobacterium sp. SC_NGM5_G05]